METSMINDLPPGPPLSRGYQPTDRDVCSGRGKKHWNLPGNIAFRNYIQTKVHEYLSRTTKMGKTTIVASIVHELRRQGFQFLKQTKDGFWYEIGDKQARDKVGHSLRDQVTAIRKAQAEGEVPTFMQQQQQQQARRRPSICLSDSGHESDQRRSELASTNMYAHFARRPSWIAGEQAEPREDSWQYVDKFMDMDISSLPDDDEASHDAIDRPSPPLLPAEVVPPPARSEDPSHALMKASLLSFDARMSTISNTTPFRRSSVLSGRSSLRNFTQPFRASDISMASEIFESLANSSFSASDDFEPNEITGL